MGNYGARKNMKPGDFGDFEGEEVVAATLAFRGSQPVDYPMAEGDVVHLLVRAEVRGVGFQRNADGDLYRRHGLVVTEATIPEGGLYDSVVDAVTLAADDRQGRQQLPLDGEGGDEQGGEE